MGLAADTVSPGEGSLADRLLDAARRLVRAEANRRATSPTARTGAGRSSKAKPNWASWGPPPRATSSSKPAGIIRPRWPRLEVDARRRRLDARRSRRSRSRGHGRPVRHAGQSGPDQRLLPHRSQQERSRASIAPAWRPPRSDRWRVFGAGIMGAGIAAANLQRQIAGRRDRRRPKRPWPTASAHVLGRSVVQQKDQGARRPAGDQVRPAAQRHDGRRRIGPGRPGHRGDRRKPRREEGALRPARAAVGQGRRSWPRTRRPFKSPSWPRA